MKRVLKVVSLMMMIVMCFSMTAFAAEADGEKVLEATFTGEGEEKGDLAEKVVLRAPAPPVSSVQVVEAKIKTDGYVYVTVRVIGYGNNIYATYDGMQCSVSKIEPIGSPIVTGYLYEVKCAVAVVGDHNFTFRITSVNSPWNTMSTSSVISVS